jgi:hypothetical protein
MNPMENEYLNNPDIKLRLLLRKARSTGLASDWESYAHELERVAGFFPQKDKFFAVLLPTEIGELVHFPDNEMVFDSKWCGVTSSAIEACQFLVDQLKDFCFLEIENGEEIGQLIQEMQNMLSNISTEEEAFIFDVSGFLSMWNQNPNVSNVIIDPNANTGLMQLFIIPLDLYF